MTLVRDASRGQLPFEQAAESTDVGACRVLCALWIVRLDRREDAFVIGERMLGTG